MDVLDLGPIDETVLVFGGPYSNLQATEALLEEAHRRSISPDHMICTGDVVAYCANPVETIAAIRASGVHVVMGNCEESLGFQLEDCGCGFEENTACDILSKQWYAYSDALLSDDDRHWLRTRPRRIAARIGWRNLSFIHGSVSDISGWVFRSTDSALKASDLDALDCDGVVAGHCGLPFIDLLPDGRMWLNTGVIGMPANDGARQGWFGLITPDNGDLRIELEPLPFDTAAAARAMREARLADDYARALESGLWPNMDVLPDEERRLRGVKFEKTGLCWQKSAMNAA